MSPASSPLDAAVRPELSVVVATLGACGQLTGLLESIASAGARAIETIVIDGGSCDGTVELLRGMAAATHELPLVWRSAPDSGIADAWNRGVALATGTWVLFLGADDRVNAAGAMNAVLDRLHTLPESVHFAALPVQLVSPTGQMIGTITPRVGEPGGFPTGCSLPHQGVFHRRFVWQEHGCFDTSLRIASDHEFLVRAWAAGERPLVLDGLAAPVRMAFGGTSKRSPLANAREYGAVRRRYGIRMPCRTLLGEWLRAAGREAAVTVCGHAVANSLSDAARRLRGLPPAWTVR